MAASNEGRIVPAFRRGVDFAMNSAFDSAMLRRSSVFFVVACALAWLPALALRAFDLPLNGSIGLTLRALAMFAPLIAALFAERISREASVPGLYGLELRLVGRWHVTGWLLPIALALLAFGVALLLPGVEYASDLSAYAERLAASLSDPQQVAVVRAELAGAELPAPLFLLGIPTALIAGILPNAIFAFGEEAGWRGFLQRELAPLGFWKASFWIGALWGLWHAPWILLGHNYPGFPLLGLALMTLWCVLLSPLLGYLSIRSRSVVPAALFHGVLNASPAIAGAHLSGGADWLVGIAGLAGILATALLTCGLFVFLRSGRLSVPRNRFHAPKPYRPNAGAVILNARGEALAGERLNMPGAFQYPQGGIDPGEDALDGARREVYEELGLQLNSAAPLHTVPDWLLYDFPEGLGGKLAHDYSGQKQKWFFFFWDGPLEELNLDAHEREFSRVIWMRPDALARQIVEFKRPIYRRLAREARRAMENVQPG